MSTSERTPRQQSVRSKTRSQGANGRQAGGAKAQVKQPEEPTSWKTAIIRMLPSDNAGLMGMLVQVTFIVIGIINYAHTQNIEGFLAMYGAGSIGSTGVQQVTKRLPSSKGDQSRTEG